MTDARELQKVLDNTPFLLTHCSRDLRYLSVSKAYAALFGRTPDEVAGQRIIDIIGPGAFETGRPYAEAVLRGERVEYEIEFPCADAAPRLFHAIYVPERDEQGQIIGWIGSITDITRIKAGARALVAQLHATQRLQEISTELVGEEKIEGLYQRIVDAATAIMHSDTASLQVYNPARGGQLRLLADSGFCDKARNFWKWVTPETKTTCGAALRERRRVIVAEVEESPIIIGADRNMHLENDIHAAQTTPLMSRAGNLLGMISTHWRHPHHPQEQDLVLFDVLARQAADLIERTQTEEHTRLLSREVSHRAKNLLAVVQGIVQQTFDGDDLKGAALSARLAALAASQDLIVQSDWRGVCLSELICSQLRHLDALVGTRIRFDGPPVRIAPSAAQTLGMALFELGTNAVKYGALSNGKGTVSIQWLLVDDSDAEFRLSWQEQNGPTVHPPRRGGFGTEVMVEMVEHALDAKVHLDYNPIGASWRVSAPVKTVVSGTLNGLKSVQGGRDA